jgi:hypothetical protein
LNLPEDLSRPSSDVVPTLDSLPTVLPTTKFKSVGTAKYLIDTVTVVGAEGLEPPTSSL